MLAGGRGLSARVRRNPLRPSPRGQCTRNQREPAQHCVQHEDHATRNDQPDVVRPVACRCDHHPEPLEELAIRRVCLCVGLAEGQQGHHRRALDRGQREAGHRERQEPKRQRAVQGTEDGKCRDRDAERDRTQREPEKGGHADLQRVHRGVLQESRCSEHRLEQHEVHDGRDDDLHEQKRADRTACTAMRARIGGADHGVPPRPSRAASARTIVAPGCAGESHATGDD